MRPYFNMIERFKIIFNGLQRAHGCTYIEKKNVDGTKVKGQTFVKRQHVNEELWSKIKDGELRCLSIEGYFVDKMQKMSEKEPTDQEILEALNEIIQENQKQNK